MDRGVTRAKQAATRTAGAVAAAPTAGISKATAQAATKAQEASLHAREQARAVRAEAKEQGGQSMTDTMRGNIKESMKKQIAPGGVTSVQGLLKNAAGMKDKGAKGMAIIKPADMAKNSLTPQMSTKNKEEEAR